MILGKSGFSVQTRIVQYGATFTVLEKVDGECIGTLRGTLFS